MALPVVVVAVMVAFLWRLWTVWPAMNEGGSRGGGSSSRSLGSMRGGGGQGKGPIRTCFVLGSGGHTGELMPLVQCMSRDSYSPRIYVVQTSDSVSSKRVEAYEGQRRDVIMTGIPRARFVGQSYVTSVFTSAYSILWAVFLVFKWRPQLIVCNGPAICIPMALASLLLRVVCGSSVCRVVFIESGCRVTSLSLSGKLMYHLRLCDTFLVQWERLKETAAPRALYMGRTL